jgi:hypothetical protein
MHVDVYLLTLFPFLDPFPREFLPPELPSKFPPLEKEQETLSSCSASQKLFETP